MLTLSGLDPSRPAVDQAEIDRCRQLGEAAVFLSKSAGNATISYGLAGRLICSKSGWGLLEVPNALIRGAFDALHEVGAELPPSHGKNLRAHISVLRPEELEQIGGPDKVSEFGHTFPYTLGPLREVEPAGWSEMSKVWFIEVKSPALEKFRKSYGLSATPKNGEFQFHITVAVKRKKVTQPGMAVTKAAVVDTIPCNGNRVTGDANAETLREVQTKQGDILGRSESIGRLPSVLQCLSESVSGSQQGQNQGEGSLQVSRQLATSDEVRWPFKAAGASGLAEDDLEMHEREVSRLQGLRRPRDHGMPKVAGEFPQLLQRYGTATEFKAHPGTEGNERQLRAGKLSLGDGQGATTEQEKQSGDRSVRTIAVVGSLGRGNRSEGGDVAPSFTNMACGESADDTAEKQALLDDYAAWRDANPVKSTLGYFVPGVGTAMSGADAAHSFSKGDILSGVGHSLLAGVSLIPGGGVLGAAAKGIGRLAGAGSRVARGTAAAGKAMTGAGNAIGMGSLKRSIPTTIGGVGALSLGGEPKIAADHVTTIAVDLDGTLAKPGPFKGPDHFYMPRRGAVKFMKSLKEKGYRLIINTCRGDVESIEEWLNEHGIPFDHINDNPDQPDGTSDKLYADIYLDDRAVHADGDWSRIMEDIETRLEQRAEVKKGSVPEPIHRLLNLPPIQDWLADKSLQGNLVFSDGRNLAIQAQHRAERRAAWAAAKQNAKLDQPTYQNFLGGLATMSGAKPNPKTLERASNDMATLSPYLATMFAQKRGGVEEVMPYLDDIIAAVMAHRAKQNNPSPTMPKLTLGLPPESVEMPKVAKVHGTSAVTVQRRDAEVLICPHCGEELKAKDIYRDAKGWTFCRPCFRKGKGSIKIPEWIHKTEKSAIEAVAARSDTVPSLSPDHEHLARCSEPVDANEFILP